MNLRSLFKQTTRFFCSSKFPTPTPPIKFEAYLKSRREQAEKSLLIQIAGPDAVHEIESYLTTQFGPLDYFYSYLLPGKQGSVSGNVRNTDSFWLLTEFKNRQHYLAALEDCRFAEGTFPYKSSSCWFSQPPGKSFNPKKPIKRKSKITDFGTLIGRSVDSIDFSGKSDLSSQIQLLEHSLKISEPGIRVRFLISAQLEQALSGLFPSGCVLPFGSTVSGIGRQSGDLDLVLLANDKEIFPHGPKNEKKSSDSGRLWFQSKMSTSQAGSARFQVQRLMETVADIIQLFVPGSSQVQRILQARVPILRFWSDYTDLQCDLSMTNATGVHMSEILYLMAQLDSRFATLCFAIRIWVSFNMHCICGPTKRVRFIFKAIYFF